MNNMMCNITSVILDDTHLKKKKRLMRDGLLQLDYFKEKNKLFACKYKLNVWNKYKMLIKGYCIWKKNKVRVTTVIIFE